MRAALLGVSLSIALVAIPARAAEGERSRARLDLVRTPGTEACIEKRGLERAVERRLRRKVFQEPAGLLVEVRIARTERDWIAGIVLYDAHRRELGRRELDTAAKDCSALDASLALVLALLVDSPPEPEPEPTETPPHTPAAPPTPPEPRPPPTPIVLPKDTFAPREPWRFVPTAAFAGAIDRLPGFAFGPRAGVAFLPPRFPEFRLSVGALLPYDETEEGERFGGSFWLVDALVEICPLGFGASAVRVSGCLGQSVGRLSVTGFGFDQNGVEAASLDLVLTAGLSSWFVIAGPFGVRLGLGAGFPLSRNSYGYRTPDGARLEFWQRGYVLGSGELAVGLEL
jgi:hypothetical protein